MTAEQEVMKEYRRRELAEMARAYLAKGHNTCTVSPTELLELLADQPAATKTAPDDKAASIARDVECYQAGWAAGLARAAETCTCKGHASFCVAPDPVAGFYPEDRDTGDVVPAAPHDAPHGIDPLPSPHPIADVRIEPQGAPQRCPSCGSQGKGGPRLCDDRWHVPRAPIETAPQGAPPCTSPGGHLFGHRTRLCIHCNAKEVVK